MLYSSTRNNLNTATPKTAVLKGIADDGGLFILNNLKDLNFNWKNTITKNTFGIATDVLSFLLPDFKKEEMACLVEKAYNGKFEDNELTPTVKVGDNYILELFRGPTSAFKDVALSMLPQLITAAKKDTNLTDDIVILTATSGDTGKAALEGFHNVDGTKIIVFYPNGGVSQTQKAQMVTQKGNNVYVCAINGNFDDAQTGVKNIFNTVNAKGLLKGKGVVLSSANSINIGRLAPQVVYYFKSYKDLLESNQISLGDKVNFVVPTGNFGDILAGYFAKLMGLPVAKLICASNKNNVLTDFIKTGTYNKNRVFYKTTSPSMDILVSSNLERLLYLLSDGNDKEIANYMQLLNKDGYYTVSEKIQQKLKDLFFAGCCDDTTTAKTIKFVYENYGYLCDTHTAVGYNVMQQFKNCEDNGCKTVVLSTASPYKFSVSVLSALGYEIPENEFEVMKKLNKITNVPIPKNLASLEHEKVLHTDIIEKQDMLKYVLEKVENNE